MQPANILIVDDLPEKRLVLESVLEELGQNVVSASSGQEALKHVLNQEFAVILLDVNMPGMDGYETAELIRRRKRSAHTPIIFITAYADEVQTAHGYALGAVDYLLSPIVPTVLRSKVSVFVDLFRMTQQVKRQADERVALAHEQAARLAAEETNRRLSFLAEASNVLASSLDLETTLQGLLRLAVPQQADLAAIALVDERAAIYEVNWAWHEPESGPRAARLPSAAGLPPRLAEALETVIAAGKPMYSLPTGVGPLEGLAATFDSPGDSLASVASTASRSESAAAEHAAVFDAMESAVVLPLLARGRTLGALALGLGRSERRFTAADVALAEELAGRAAIALDNARLYRDVQLADRRKNEFLSMLAHELRNPLAPILNGVQVLRMAGFAPPELEQIHDVIERQVHHLVRMVDDLLDISRITSGKIRLQREPIVVAGVVARAVEASRPLMEARRHTLTVTPSRESLRVHADAVRLAQVLTNLLNNAAKYTNEGGRISLTFEHEGDDVVFRVRDTGVGIPADMLASVFELFTQVDQTLDRSQGGLGIGLTLVRNLVEMHGGSVQAFSPGSGLGSEFVVRLTAIPDESSGSPSTADDAPTTAVEPRRILVVDDNVDAAATLALLLRGVGHEVRTAKDGVEALAAVETFSPDIGLLDIGLPGMDGYDLARRLRETQHGSQLVLVALTGYGQERDVQRSRQAGFDHHLIKPVDFTRLTEYLRPAVRNAEQNADSVSSP